MRAVPSSANLTALRRMGYTKPCACQPQRGDHDYGLGGPRGCEVCGDTGEIIDWPAVVAALMDAEEAEP